MFFLNETISWCHLHNYTANIFALDLNKLNSGAFSQKDQTKLKMFPVWLANSLSLWTSTSLHLKKKGKKKRAIARGKWSSECYSVLWALMASVNDMGCSVVCVLLSHPWCNDPSTLMPPQGTMSTSIPHLHLYNYPHLLCAGAAPTVSTAGWFHYQQLCNSVRSVSP